MSRTLKNIIHLPNFKGKLTSELIETSYNNIKNGKELTSDFEKELDFRLNKAKINRLWTIFLSCQKTKTDQMIQRIKTIINTKQTIRSLSVIMCQNDSNIAIQTSERLHREIPIDSKVFLLSSSIVK